MENNKMTEKDLQEELDNISYLEGLGLTPETINAIEDALNNRESLHRCTNVEDLFKWKISTIQMNLIKTLN